MKLKESEVVLKKMKLETSPSFYPLPASSRKVHPGDRFGKSALTEEDAERIGHMMKSRVNKRFTS